MGGSRGTSGEGLVGRNGTFTKPGRVLTLPSLRSTLPKGEGIPGSSGTVDVELAPCQIQIYAWADKGGELRTTVDDFILRTSPQSAR